MIKPGPPAVLAVFLVLLATVDCGTTGSPHVLKSIVVTPSSAHAQDFPNGQVPFKATGTFDTPPSPAMVTDTSWCMGAGDFSCAQDAGGTVDAHGVAQCNPGFSGTLTVQVSAPNGAGMPITGVQVFGDAQLICP
jgi:hypothetical protein